MADSSIVTPAQAQQAIQGTYVKLNINLHGSVMACKIRKEVAQQTINGVLNAARIKNEIITIPLDSGHLFSVKPYEACGFWTEECQ